MKKLYFGKKYLPYNKKRLFKEAIIEKVPVIIFFIFKSAEGDIKLDELAKEISA